jgi:[amino group carrier protein]-lysine/ornithine hydrolase
VAALLSSIRRHGGSPKLKIKTGTTDMNIVSTRWDVPMAAYGPGDARLDHTSHEHLDLNHYAAAINVLRDALALLIPQVRPCPPADGYTPEEEAEIAGRLAALGYLE